MAHEALFAYPAIVGMITTTPIPDTALVIRSAMRQGRARQDKTPISLALPLDEHLPRRSGVPWPLLLRCHPSFGLSSPYGD